MSTPRIFLSHSFEDTEWARAFAAALRSQQVDVWLEGEIKAGEPMRDAIERGLRQSNMIVAVIPRSTGSANVLFEAGAALGMGKRLIPIVSEDYETSLLPLLVRNRRYLRKGTPADTAREVAAAIKEIPDSEESNRSDTRAS